jgi:hypothetical protein
MLSDYEIALLLQQQYDGVQGVFDRSGVVQEVTFAVKHYDDYDIIAFEGSHNLPDWERDFHADMVHIDKLGGVHDGFYSGLPAVLETVLPCISTQKLIKICGHSLGGGESHIFTGLLAVAEFGKLETITFGSPLPGDKQFSDILAPYPNRSYWNYKNCFEHDLVGSVPIWLPEEPYVVPRERKTFWSAPSENNPWGKGHYLAPHNLKDCYIPGMKGLQNV